MPLTAGYADNFTMKSGTTISSNELTSWAGENYTYTVPGTETGPVTNLSTLNGVDVASFDGNALQFTDAGFNRGAHYRIQHFVIRGYSVEFNSYIEDGSNNTKRTALLQSNSDAWVADRVGSTFALNSINIGAWEILTVLWADDDVSPYFSVWINDTKVKDEVASAVATQANGEGSTLGCLQSLSAFGQFDLAQYAAYFSESMPLTEQEILDNILFLNSEWDLWEVGTEFGPFNYDDGSPIESAAVEMYHCADNEGSDPIFLDNGLTDASGMITLEGDIPAGRVRLTRIFKPDPSVAGKDWTNEKFYTD